MLNKRTIFTIAAAWLIFVGLMVFVAIQDFWRSGGTTIWQPVLWEGSSAITGLSLWLSMRVATRRFDHLLETPWRWFCVQLACFPLIWITFIPIVFGIRHAVYTWMGETYYHDSWGNIFLYEALKLSIFLGLFTVILFGVLSYFNLLKAKLAAEQSTSLIRQAQLQRLTQQMQPHFLFNALNAISSLMHSNVEKADATLIQLADVLRATLEMSELHEASLALEMRLVRAYAQLMETRYEDRVTITWQIDEAASNCLIPVMSVQPMLENVFKHTVEHCRQPTKIVISASLQQQTLLVRIADDQGRLDIKEGHAGLGMRNLRARLQLRYGDAASLQLQQLSPAGVATEMRLPCTC